MSLEMFIVACLKYDNSKDMHTIVEKKIKKHYHRSTAAYKASKDFKNLLQTRIAEIERDSKNLHTYVKEVVDELKLRCEKESPPRKKMKLGSNSSENGAEEHSTVEVKEEVQPSHFRERAAKKLSKMLHCLQKKILKLEEKEVDWDDDNDSSYIQLQRYKERAVAVYKKLQEYEIGVLPKLQNKRTISFSGTPFMSVNRAIEKYVNKTGQFPDYREVLKLLKSAYEEEKINTTPEKLRIIAKAAFQNIGEQLQRQRQVSVWNAHSYYLGRAKDPAEEDQELDSKLQQNKEQYGNRIAELIEKFAEGSKDIVSENDSDISKGKKSDKKKKDDKEDEEEDDDVDDADDNAEADDEDDDEEEEIEEESASKDGPEDNFIEDILTGLAETDTSDSEKVCSDEDDSHVESAESGLKEIVYSDESSKGNCSESDVKDHEQKTPQEKIATEKLVKQEGEISDQKADILHKDSSKSQAEEIVTCDGIKIEAKDEHDIQKSKVHEGFLTTDISESTSFSISKSENSLSCAVTYECKTSLVKKPIDWPENSSVHLEKDNNIKTPKYAAIGNHHLSGAKQLETKSYKCSTIVDDDDDDDVIVLD